MSRMPTDGIDALYDQLAGGQAAADPVDALYDQIAGPQAAPSRGLLGRAEDTAASFTAGLAGGIPQAVGQFARLGQATQYAAANPLRTGALAASSAARFAMDPASAIAGTPSMAQQVGQYMNSAADAIPRMPLTASQQLVAQGAGGIADTAGLVGRSALSVAPAAASVPFSPESIAMNVGQTLPMQAASMGAAALGGQPGAFASSMLFESASIVDESYNRLKEANPKMTDQDALERAFLPSVLAAIPAAALDAGTGGEAAVARGVKKQAESAAKSLARRVLASGKEIGRSAIEEALTEPIQGLIEDVGSAVAQPSTAQMQPGDVHAMLVKRGTEALVGGLMGGVGAATVAIPNAAQEPMAPAVAPQQAPQVAAPQPVQAPAQPVDPRVEAVQQSAADRLAGKQAPATPEPGELLRSLGVERQPDQAALEQQQPPAGRQASTLADLLRDETIKPETRKSLADRYAAGEITRDELAAMLEAQIEASPEEKVRREFEAMAAKGSESAPPAAPEPVASEPPKIDQPAQEGVQQSAGPVGGAVQAEQAIQPPEAAQAPAPSTQTPAAESSAPRETAGTVEQQASAAPLFRPVRQVVTPAGALAASETKTRAPSSPWWRQGDPHNIAFDAVVRVEGQEPAEDAKRLYEDVRAANKAGWKFVNVRAGKFGTVWTLQKDGNILTHRGLADIRRTVGERPGVEVRKGGTDFSPDMAKYASALVKWIDETVPGASASSAVITRSIRRGAPSKWVKLSRSPVSNEYTLDFLREDGSTDLRLFGKSMDELYANLRQHAAGASDRASVEPQRQGAESVAPQAKEPTNGNPIQEGRQEGRPEGLLNQQTPAVSENTPAPAAGESFPAFRGWRWRKTAGNAGAMVPNVPGQKFTQAEIDTLKNWATSRGLTVNVASPTQVRVIGPANQSLSLARYGAQGVKEDASRARRAEAARAQQEQAASREAEANSAESSAWVEETFGKGNINPYNRIQLSQFVEGKSNERRFLTTSRWEDGLRKIGALDAEGNVNWERVREAYQSSRAPVESAPATSSTPAAGAESADIPRVRFKAPPPYMVRKRLKDAGFTWNADAKEWQGPNTDAARAVAAEVEAGRQAASASKAAPASPAPESSAPQTETAPAPKPTPEPKKPNTAALRAAAESKKAQGEEKLNRDRQTNTARRARMAASVEADARGEIALGELGIKVADALDSGEVPALINVRSMADIEYLTLIARRARREYYNSLTDADKDRRFPRRRMSDGNEYLSLPMEEALPYVDTAANPSVHSSNYRSFVDAVGNLPRSKQAAQSLRRWNTTDNRVYVGSHNAPILREWATKLGSRAALEVLDAVREYDRIVRLTDGGTVHLKNVVSQLDRVRKGVKVTEVDPVTTMERELVGRKDIGVDFFPTPPTLAARMAEMADIKPGMKVLEPSAGNGHIADAIKVAGVTPDVVEVSSTLRDILKAKGYAPVEHDFLDYNPGPIYDRIVMNPPFSNRRDVDHVMHAMKLLKPGGKLVAIVGEGPFFGQDKKAQQFRGQLDFLGAETEKLPGGTFMEDQRGLPTTGVAARLVTIDKPAAELKKAAENASVAVRRDSHFEYEGKRERLLRAPADQKDAAASDITREQARRILDSLDAAPGDDLAARKALLAKYPDLAPASAPQTKAANRDQVINDIVAAARNKDLEPVEHFELLGSDGKWRRPGGFPIGVKATGERRSIGFNAVGKWFKTKEEALAGIEEYQQKQDSELRSTLESSSDDDLKEHAQYWLKFLPEFEKRVAAENKSETPSPQVSELRERRALRFNGERWQYRVSPTSGWTSALSKDAAIEAATRSLQDQAVPKFPTAASRLRDGLGPIDASEIESEWNNVVRQVENEREDSVVRRANAAAAALDGLPAKFRDRIAGEFRDQYPHIVEYMTSRKMTPIDVAASLQNNQPSQEPANAPEPQPEQPAPEPTASTPMEGPEGLGSDPTDHGGVTWDSAANQLERDQANVKSLEQEEARLNELPDSQGWQTPTSIQLAKIRNELRTLQVNLKTREKTVEQAAKLRKAIGDGQVTDEKRAREIVSAANAAPLLGLQNIPAAGLRAIRTAERMLLKPVDVDAGAGTTLYVWSEAWGDEGFDDRVKQAKSLAAKMKKEEAAAARELARIDKQGAMVTPAGKVVARPSPKETESTTDKPRTVKVFKTDQERLAGISVATARETSRYAINGVNVSKGGTEVAATDGRRLLIHVRPEGFGVKDGLYLDGNGNDIAKGVLTKPGTKDDGQFSPYGDIIPRLDTVKPVGAFDPLELLSMARKAQVMTSEQSNGVIFMVGSEETPKGQTRTVAGMYANAADVGEVWVGRGRAEAVFCINPQFLIESLEWHAKNGSPIVSIYNESPRKPIVIVGADGTMSVIMPINALGNAPESAVDPRAPIAPPSLRESETAGSRSAYETILKSAAGDRPAVSARGKRGNPKRRSFAEMADQTIGVLDRIASSARERMRQREAQGVRLYSNPFLAPEFYSDMRDIALVAAAEAFKAGIKGGRKLTAIVEKAIATHRPALQERAAEVRQVAAKMLRAANGDPDRFEQVANTVVNQPPRTRAEARAARKAKVEARQAAANAKPPAEAPTVTATTAMKASLKAAEKAANKVQRQAAAVIKSTIVRSYRNGVEAGVARAKAQFMPMVRSLREAAKRNRAMSGIEMRGVADAAAAKQAEVDAIRTTIRKLAQDLPPGIRGKFLTAVEQGTTPLKLARAVRDMHRALSRWEATQFARRIGKWTTKKRLARLDNARRRAVRMMAAVAGTDWATVKAKGTDANAMRAAADRLRDTYEAIRQQYAEHYAENKRIKALREQTAKEAAEEAADNIMRAKKPMPAPEGRKDVRTHPMVRLAQGAMDLLNALQSVEGKFDGSGVLERVVYQPMLRAEDKFFSELRNRTKQIEQAVRRAGFGGLRQAFEALSPMGGKAAERTIDVVLGGKTQTISLGQAISLAAIDSQTEELIDAGMKVQMRDGRFREPIVVTMKEVQAIRQRLASTEPKLLRMVSELKGIMEEMRPGVFRVHRILKGFEPEIVPDRWPRVRNLSAGEKTQALPESSHELVNRVLENSGFLKERTGGTDAPMLVDHVLNVIFDQVEQSSKVMHLAIPVRDAAGVLLDSRVRVAVSDRWGGDLYTKLKQMLMAASRANQVLNTKGARTVHAINSALAIRYLATNVGTYGRQVAGAARLIPYFSAKDWAHGVANAHKVSVEDMANKSGYFWDRYIGNAAGRMSAVMSDEAADRTQPAAIAAQRLALRNLMKRDLHAAYRAQLNVGRAILQTVNFFDGLVARTAWAAAENQARREHPEWSDAKRNRWVADRAAEVIRDTQNGSSPMDLAINAALNRDSGMAAWFLFTSDMYKARNRIARAFKRSAEDGMKMVAAEAASIVIGTALARAAGWGAGRLIASAFGADDKDKRKIDEYYWMPERMAWDVAKQIVPITRPLGPILGQPMVDIMQGARGGGFTPPALEAINQIYQSVANAANAAKKGDAEKFIKRLGKVVYEVGSTAGLNPFGWLLDKVMREIQKDSPTSGRMGGLKGRL